MARILGPLALLLAQVRGFVVVQQYQERSSELYARKPLITGNWKLNPSTQSEAVALAKEIADAVNSRSPTAGLFVPFVFLTAVKEAVGDRLFVGAETSFPVKAGAYTGAISPTMLQGIGVEWALAGHSERRTIFGETNDDINAQCRMLVESGMKVVLCIGETEEEYEKNLVGRVCEIQLKKGLESFSKRDMKSVAIAYEPVWAIGTGKVATPEIAQSVHARCRQILADMYGGRVARKTRILYGGSVTDESIDGLMEQPDIDGALVGGASLDAAKFARIINYERPVGRWEALKNKAKSIKSKVKTLVHR